MITLDEMIKRGGGKCVSNVSWVRHPGFKALYVRIGRKYIGRHPQYDIHVENALAQRFRDGLKRMGFLDNALSVILLTTTFV